MTLELETQLDHNDQNTVNTSSQSDDSRSIDRRTDNSIDGRILNRAKTLIIELKDILEKETAALKSSDLHTAIGCQDKKIKLIKEYEQLVTDARQNEALLKSSKNQQKDDIRNIQDQLNNAIDNNKRALNNSKKAVDRLTTRIMDTIRKCVKSEENIAYSAAGTVSTSPRGLSMKVDETL